VLLDHRVLVQLGLHLLDAGCEAIPYPFELVNREDTGATHSGDGEIDPLAGKSRAEQSGQRQLHRGYLATQIGARRAPVVLVEDGIEAVREECGVGAVEQLRHESGPSSWTHGSRLRAPSLR
jgi:hypothetical protein